MITTYIRSSSLGTLDLCEQQYFINYVLGIPSGSNKKADKGNVVHKVMESLGHYKLALQEGRTEWLDDNFGPMRLEDCTNTLPMDDGTYILSLLRKSYDYYVKTTKHKWQPADFRDCCKWSQNIFDYNGGLYDPRNRKIILPEKSFDFHLDLPWAKYDYVLADGTHLEGTLRMCGTIDMITERRPGVIEIIDWKTGERMDWATGKEKTYEKLSNDTQLRMYHYAAHHEFPQYEDIFITIFFARDGKFQGGPFTTSLTRDDLKRTEDILQEKFEHIKNTTLPYLTPHPKWSGLPSKHQEILPCTTFCKYGKENWPGSAKNICHFIKDEIRLKGIEQVTSDYGNIEKLNTYGDAAGRKAEDRK